jgi:hypothetical protein
MFRSRCLTNCLTTATDSLERAGAADARTSGAVVTAAEVAWFCRTCPHAEVVHLGTGTHFLPEDRPTEISAALGAWLPTTGHQRSSRSS